MSGPCVVSGQCVHSHNYPGSYADDEHCTLQPVHGQPLRVQAFNTEEDYDFLTINGVRYSGSGGTDEHGNSIPEDIVPDREITWSSDGSVGRSGWLICQESSRPHAPPFPPSEPPSPPSPPSPPLHPAPPLAPSLRDLYFGCLKIDEQYVSDIRRGKHNYAGWGWPRGFRGGLDRGVSRDLRRLSLLPNVCLRAGKPARR